MLHQVLRKFRAEGVERKAGYIVETASWKNERLLLEHRFLGKPSVPQKDVASVVEGANVVPVPESNGAISEPEPPKATPTKKVVVKTLPLKSGKPAVLKNGLKRVPVVGKVPVATAAKQVKKNG